MKYKCKILKESKKDIKKLNSKLDRDLVDTLEKESNLYITWLNNIGKERKFME